MIQQSKKQRLCQEPCVWVILLWTIEIWLVQQHTFGFDYPTTLSKRLTSASWRLIIDLLGVSAFVLIMPRLVVSMFTVFWVIAAIILLTYHDLFERALSWRTFSEQFIEGVEGAGYDIGLLLNLPFYLLILLLGFKLYWLWGNDVWKRKGPVFVRSRVGIGVFVLVMYLVSTYVGTTYMDRLTKLKRFVSVDRMGSTHGYLVTWFGEMLYLNNKTLLKEAIVRGATIDNSVIDRLGPLELENIDDIAILQIESLDWRSLGHTFNEQEIVPFLRRRMGDSILFRTQAVHDNGSADADFVWLTGKLPSPRVVTYKITHYPYSNTLADKARSAGFRSLFAHGNKGAFFNRRMAIGKMNFDDMLFSEEFLQAGLPLSLWGIDDDDVLDSLADKLNEKSRLLVYAVTLSSHFPFEYIPPRKQLLEADPSSLEERYFTSINYTDNAVSSFYDQLPNNTLVIMFGDHSSPAEYEPTDKAFSTSDKIVPVFVHLKGSNLRDRLSLSSPYLESTMLGVSSWIHNWLAVPK